MSDINDVKLRLETGTVHGDAMWTSSSFQASADSGGSFLHHGTGYIRPTHLTVGARSFTHSRYFVKFDQGPELQVDDGLIASDGHRVSRVYLSSPESNGEYYAGLYNNSTGTSDLNLHSFANAIGIAAPVRPTRRFMWTAVIPLVAGWLLTVLTGRGEYIAFCDFVFIAWLLYLLLIWNRRRSRRYAEAQRAYESSSGQLIAAVDEQLSATQV